MLEFIVQCAPHVSPVLMHALVRRESAFNPFAIGPDSGQDAVPQPKTLIDAVKTAQELKAAGKKFSVGLAQIHMRNVEARGLSWEQVFDPCKNLSLGQTILWDFYRTARKEGYQGVHAVWAALRGYNSGGVHRTISDKYAQAIFTYMQEKQDGVVPAVAMRTTPASQPAFASLAGAVLSSLPAAIAAHPAEEKMGEAETLDIFQKGEAPTGM